MKARFDHLQMNVSDVSFYVDLFKFLKCHIISQSEGSLGVETERGNIWVMEPKSGEKQDNYNRHSQGLHHLALAVDSKEEVDTVYNDFVKPHHAHVLYGGPKAYPEYTNDYYAVSFEDPDKIVIEVMYNK